LHPFLFVFHGYFKRHLIYIVNMPTKNKKNKQPAATAPSKDTTTASSTAETAVAALTDGLAKTQLNYRTCTGVLSSRPQDRDVKITAFSLSYHGKVLIAETELELKYVIFVAL